MYYVSAQSLLLAGWGSCCCRAGGFNCTHALQGPGSGTESWCFWSRHSNNTNIYLLQQHPGGIWEAAAEGREQHPGC